MKRNRLAAIVTCWIGVSASLPAFQLLDESANTLLVEAVAAAAELDLFHARCRSDVSGRRSDNLNKLLVDKARTTILNVQDNLFPEQDYRESRERIQREFMARLKQAGGCGPARQGGMQQELEKRYDQLLGQIRALP